MVIDEYRQMKVLLGQAEAWFSKYGHEYRGGGGGIGHFKSLVIPKGEPTIYHQPYDGANNYHECPSDVLRNRIAAKLAAHLPTVVGAVITELRAELAALAAKAQEEFQADINKGTA